MKTTFPRTLACVAAALILCLSLHRDAQAANITWIGAISSDWNNPTNWNPAQVPTAGDHVIINSGNVAAPAEAQFAVLDWTDGTISGQLSIASNSVINWSGGIAVGSLTVASNGVLNLDSGSSGTVNLWNTLTNAGTVNWLSGGISQNTCGGPSGPYVNLPGGLWDIQCDAQLNPYYGCGAGAVLFQNAGTVRKRSSTGTTSLPIPFSNTGTVEVQTGTLVFNGSGTIDGVFNAAAGTTISFDGTFVGGATPSLNGPGTNQFVGGNLTLLDDVIPNLQMTGGTISLGTNFQGGTITNLTLVGPTLNGDHTVSGTFNCGNGFSGSLLVASGASMTWTGGIGLGALNVASNGVLNLDSGTVGVVNLWNTLTNAGAVNWLSGGISQNTCGGPSGPYVNLPGGLWDIQCDAQLNPYYGCGAGAVLFQNAGTVRKRGSTGTTSLPVPFSNTGTVEVQSGTFVFNGDFIQTPSGSLAVSLGGINPGSDYGHIQFTSPLTMAGSFAVSLRNGFRPNPGDTFNVLSYPSTTNEFVCLSGLDLGDGVLLLPQFTPTSLSLLASTYMTNASQPQLFITRSPTGVRLTWPLGFPNWVLQFTTNLDSAAWSPMAVECDENQALAPTAMPEQYFRLKQE